MKTGKRIGYLAMCLVVLIASLAVQVIAAVIVVVPVSFVVGFQAAAQGIVNDMDAYLSMYNSAIESATTGALVLTHLLLLLTFGLWYRFGCGKNRLKDVQFKKIFAPKNLLVMVLIGVGMCFCTNFAMTVLYPVIPDSIMQSYEQMMESAAFGENVFTTIAAVLIAPFGEEFIYRGVCFYYAKRAVADLSDRRKAFWIANCVQALGFGIFHFNLIQGVYAFFMGLLLGYLAHRFKSLLPAMLGHMLVNGISSFVWEPVATALPESYAVYAAGAVIALAVVIAGLYLGGPAEKNNVTIS